MSTILPVTLPRQLAWMRRCSNAESNPRMSTKTPNQFLVNLSVIDLEKLPKIEKSDETIARIKACIGKNVLCSKLSDKYTEALVNAMKEITAKQGESVIKQGELGDYWFVVESGALEVFKTGDGETEGKKVNSYKPGDSFGELALMFNQRRAASVVATEDVVLWAVDQATFRALVLTAATENKTKYD